MWSRANPQDRTAKFTSARLVRVIRADVTAIAALKGAEVTRWSGRLDVFSLPGTWAVILFRLASWFHEHRLRPLSRLLYFLNCVLFSCEVQPGASIGPGFVLAHPIGVCIGSDVIIGADFRAMGNVRIGGIAAERAEDDGFPEIGDGCWFLDGAKAFGPIVIGDRTVLASSAVATTSLPSDVWAGGIPARVLKPRSEPAQWAS